jgi:membrane protein YdbS with pleckstrin-like domain
VNRVYQSAFDTWLIFVIYASPVLLLVMGGYFVFINRPNDALTCFVLAIALTLMNLVLTRPCRYTLTADSLNVRCGLMSKTIPLQRIQGAELTLSLLSGPALSIKRVRIQLDKGRLLISPVDRQQFIDDLMKSVGEAKSA